MPMKATACRDRHHFGDRHPVDPIHEIDEVDEPQDGEAQSSVRSSQ